ncbi:MAG TPA: DUF58 domain-containing protein [Candidatus Lumbricidophila sp.]|nr:DUF58 domain-containing protein [Candidatus Lumbricidophila sp.]
MIEATGRSDHESQEGALAVAITRALAWARDVAGAIGRVRTAINGTITSTGWAVAGGSIAALIIGSGLGWREFTILGWALLCALLVAAIWLIGGRLGQVSLEVPNTRVVVGETATAVVATGRRLWRRIGLGSIELPVGSATAALSVAHVARSAQTRQEIAISTDHRGVLTIGPARRVQADPLGLLSRVVELTGTAQLLVRPRIVAIQPRGSGLFRDLDGDPTPNLTPSDIAFHALREYQAGDDRRHIHWRSSAKTGRFMVRQFEETRRSKLMVILDCASSGYASSDEFELAVSAAASIGVRAILDGRSMSFAVSSRRGDSGGKLVTLPTFTPDRLLDALCDVRVGTDNLGLADTAALAAAEASTTSLVLLVTGAARGVEGARAAAVALPAGVAVGVVLCDQGGETAAKTVAGLNILRIGYLEDLPALTARANSVAS